MVVRPFPDVNGGRYPISTDGGTLPLWAHNGHELFYLDAQNDVMSVQVDTRNGFHVGKMTRLFHLGSEYLFSSHDGTYDIAPDDQRFLFVRGPGADSKGPPGIILVENWTQEVKAKLGR